MLDVLTKTIDRLKGSERPNELTEVPKKFAILTVARTGSNYLCSALNGHPDILCHGELFHKKKIFLNKTKNSNINLGSMQERNWFPKRFINRIWKQNFGYSAVGFKLFQKHNVKALDFLLKDKEVKKILLFRRNKVKSYISLQIARKKQEWSLKASVTEDRGKTQRPISVKIKPKKLCKYVEETNQFYEDLRQKLKASNQKFIEIAYEDLFSPGSEALKAELLEFIGVPVDLYSLKSDLKKQNPQPLSELVSNFDELESALRGTELEPYLYLPDF